MRGDSGKRYLSGVIWDVYLYVLTSNEPIGVRDVWRGLRLSSPSLAQYHINHLLDMHLIAQTDEGRYVAEEKKSARSLEKLRSAPRQTRVKNDFLRCFCNGLVSSLCPVWFHSVDVPRFCSFNHLPFCPGKFFL